MSIEVKTLLKSGAAQKCKSMTGFLSPIFLRPKSDGTFRPIFDLRNLNFYLKPPRFRLLNHFRIPLCLNVLDYMCKIDLSQAYFHIPITKAHRRFLAFYYKNTVYQMTCLPFGLATAPCTFANISNWLANRFREEGIRVIVYLDDFLLMNTNPQILENQTQRVLETLTKLGWCVNMEKSIMNSTQVIEYLGVIWNTQLNLKYLPDPKIRKTIQIIKDTLKKNWWTWHTAKIILGHINFAAFAVPLGRLHSRSIQIQANLLPESDRNKKFPLLDATAQDLHWWANNIN